MLSVNLSHRIVSSMCRSVHRQFSPGLTRCLTIQYMVRVQHGTVTRSILVDMYEKVVYLRKWKTYYAYLVYYKKFTLCQLLQQVFKIDIGTHDLSSRIV